MTFLAQRLIRAYSSGGTLRSNTRSGKYNAVLLFAAVAVVSLWQLLTPGYVFALDMVFGPNSARELLSETWNGLGHNSAIRGASPLVLLAVAPIFVAADAIAPMWVLQKILLFALLMVTGLGMYRLVPVTFTGARYYAGLMYVINPFFYVRFLAGHFLLLWSYALAPFAIRSFLAMLERPTRSSIVRAGIWLSALGVSPAILFITLGVLAAIVLFKALHRDLTMEGLRGSALAFGLFLALNAAWVITISGGSGVPQTSITNDAQAQVDLFATTASNSGNIAANVVGMYGFWRGGYDYPTFHFPILPLAGGFIFLGVAGLLARRRMGAKAPSQALAFSAVGAVVLALGTSTELTRPAFETLYDRVPFFSGFREPHKFVAILPLAYGYLGAIGLEDLFSGLRARPRVWRAMFVSVALVLPLAYSYMMLFGFWGQLSNVDYPDDYYAVREVLEDAEQRGTTLFLPWHGYMLFEWSEEKIANPADVFFPAPVISGDNIETGNVERDNQNAVSLYVESLLAQRETVMDMGRALASLGVTHVVLVKEVDFEEYGFLGEQDDLVLIEDLPRLTLFGTDVGQSASEVGSPGRADDGALRDRAIEAVELADVGSTRWRGVHGLYLATIPVALVWFLIMRVVVSGGAPDKQHPRARSRRT